MKDLSEKMWYGNFFNSIRNSIFSGGKTENCDSCGLLDMTKELRKDISKFSNYIKE